MNEQTPFEKRSQDILEESTSRLDGRTLSRLTQARHAALSRLEAPRRAWWQGYLPAGTAAAAAVLMLVVWNGRPPRVAPLPGTAAVAETAGSNAADDMELL